MPTRAVTDPEYRRAELERERTALAKADEDLASGQERIVRQRTLIESGRLPGPEQGEAERLLETLERCLFEWERHRGLILERIAYLEGLNSS